MPCLHFKIQRAPLAVCPCHRLPAMRYAWLVNQQRREREIDSKGEKERKKMSIWTSFDNCRRDWATEREERERGREECCVLVSVVAATVLHVARST